MHKQSARYLREAKVLGLRLRRLREDHGWTLEQAAERCDLDLKHLKHLQKIESGQLNVTIVTLVRLAVGFREAMATLFTDTTASKSRKR